MAALGKESKAVADPELVLCYFEVNAEAAQAALAQNQPTSSKLFKSRILYPLCSGLRSL
jgi:hypothetical protein